MSDIAALIQSLGGLAGVAALVTAVGILALQVRSGKKADDAKAAAEDAKAILVNTADGVFELGKAIDGRLSALLAAKEAEFASEIKRARAEGVAAGEQAQRDRAAEPTK